MLAASVTALLLLAPGWLPSGREAGAQRPTRMTVELSQALDRAAAGERIPVVVEVPPRAVASPLALERRQRAAEYAGNLAATYTSAVSRLRAELPLDLSVALQAGDVIWIGAAVTAMLTAEQIRALEARPEVRRLYYDGLVEVELAAPAVDPPLVWAPGLQPQGAAGGLPWGLEAIGAPPAWAAGATGTGAVVATVDSGVDGEHPLLRRRWLGHIVPPEQAWFDPWGLSAVPVDDDGLGGVGHGTIVMYTAVGAMEPGDTLLSLQGTRVIQDELEAVAGVAPDAEWVAANAFEGFGVGQYTRLSVLLQSMQWVVDPDGDPATVTDVPDVLNNSWGFRTDGCSSIFDRAIDALELAGVPVVFSAGNRSAGFDTVAAPGSRADLLLNAFAVGAVERSNGDFVVSDRSLGGPSPCAPGAVKPEVAAPGEVTLLRGTGERTVQVRGLSGAFTSWAAPHAAGALAVLAGLDPRASANDLKDALFSTAEDLPPSGLDNRSGAGLIDLPAAAERVGGLGGVQLAVTGVLGGDDSRPFAVELVNRGTLPFGGGAAELRAGGVVLGVSVAPAIASRGAGTVVFADLARRPAGGERLRLRLEADGGYLVLGLTSRAAGVTSVTLTDGGVSLALDGNGRLGGTAGATGFDFLGVDWLPGGGFLFELDGQVSDAVYVDVLQRPALKRNPVGSDTDWRARVDGPIRIRAENRATLDFLDDRALEPLGASVTQEARLVAVGDSAAFALLAATVDFPGGSALAGLFLDWDFAGRDSVGWDEGLGASVMTAPDSSGPWMALTALTAPATHAAVPLGSADFEFYEAGSGVLARLEGFEDDVKARMMRLGDAPSSTPATLDWAQLVTAGPLAPGGRALFIVAAGRSRRALRTALDSARAFAEMTVPEPPAPTAAGDGLQLQPPYPNPFDPFATDVVYLPFLVNRSAETVRATLRVYTIAGALIYEQRRQLRPDAPLQPFSWDGRLADGVRAPSGVYGYVIRVGSERRSGKFVLLK